MWVRIKRRDMGQYALLAALLISTTFLQKFGIAVSSESSLSLGLFLVAIVTVAGLAFGNLSTPQYSCTTASGTIQTLSRLCTFGTLPEAARDCENESPAASLQGPR